MKEKMIIGCILMAAGISERFGCGNKLMADLDGKPLISYPVQTLLSVKALFDRTDIGISLDLLTVTRWPEVCEFCEAAGMPCILYEGGLQSDTIRFGLEDGRARTLEEVGKEFNVTRERIRQIEAKALRKLRHPSRSKRLKDFLN